MKRILLLVLIIFLCAACSSVSTGKERLSDYPKLNKEVNNLIDELKESSHFDDISYNSIDVFSYEDGEKGYDVFYKTNCSDMTLSYSEDFELVWIRLFKSETCSSNSGFSDIAWNKQVDTMLNLQRYNVNESKFPGINGDTWDDYNELMLGKSDKSFITTDDGIIIFCDPSIYLFGLLGPDK